MGLRFTLAKAVGSVLTWGLRDVVHRPAANMPGKIALYADPSLIADLRGRLAVGSIVVAGTNGKTSTTNLLADALEAAGESVVCNRTGANLDSGVATSLLQTEHARWGVFESDELWLAKVLPGLQPRYLLLLNLFRDQLDRVGEIERIQESIASALRTSPSTVLIYNGDDPLCAAIAEAVPNESVAFGVDEDMGLVQNRVSDAQMCQECEGMLSYGYRQYGQLGSYRCERCGFARPALRFAAKEVSLGASELGLLVTNEALEVRTSSGEIHVAAAHERLRSSQVSPYLVYNLVAAYAACRMMGVAAADLQRAIDEFDPRNGRLQNYVIGGRRVLLNLAKNPTGFNQNLRIVEADSGPKAVAFFVNDKEGDGRDVSWIWDIDFEELAAQPERVVYAGGRRKHDVQVRLKYAGMDARLIDSIDEVLDDPALGPEASVYAIANYTALPIVKAALDAREQADAASGPDDVARPARPEDGLARREGALAAAVVPMLDATWADREPVVILHVFPDLLNLYGDGGNVRILQQRLERRGIPVRVEEVRHGELLDLSRVDIVVLGGGPDREQKLAAEELMVHRDALAAYVEGDGVLLAICGGYQILGRTWLLGGEVVEGLGILGLETQRPGTSADRLVDNIVLESPMASLPVVGYENHAGRTYLDAGMEPFGRVVSRTGAGNNERDRVDGVLYRNVVGTYLHGPLLAKNPEVADALLARALGVDALDPLDDGPERAANAFMRK